MMRPVIVLVILAGVVCLPRPAWSHNPFTSRPEVQHRAPRPLLNSPFFVKIIIWQHQLKQKMSELIRVARNQGHIKPLLALIGLAFFYGLIHSAGPGHGKLVAVSYVLSHRVSAAGGIFFGCCFAVIHAFSGAAGVVGLHYIIHRSVSDTLASVTTITQIVSFGMITLLGLFILVKHVRSFLHASASTKKNQSDDDNRKGLFTWAAAVGLMPCPAVVMVMLFCLSMDAMFLGLVLTASICIGMATTISFVVVAVVTGKTGILGAVSANNAIKIEIIVGTLTGAAIATFGALFLLASINSIQQ